MINIEEKDYIIDDTILDYFYKKEDSFKFDDLDKELASVFSESGIDYNIYGCLIQNTLFYLVVSGRFAIDKGNFIIADDSIKINTKLRNSLIEIKRYAEVKYCQKKKELKIKSLNVNEE